MDRHAGGRTELSTAPVVRVGAFEVADAPAHDVVEAIAGLSACDGPRLAFALHVGGLNHAKDESFVAAMRQADIVYADGGAVTLLARIAGARDIERAPTTDIGWDVLRALTRRLGRPARLALLGGPAGLAERAGAALQAGGVGQVVAVEHGYHQDWADPLSRIRAAEPDILIVGLGAPREMTWAVAHREQLPPVPVLTCGGWFGFLAGEERRAPDALRHPGLEWLARVAQDPRRLGPRYAVGCLATAALIPSALRHRARHTGGSR